MRRHQRHLIVGMLLLSLLSYPANTFAVHFGRVSYPVGMAPSAVAAGDFNGDQKTDLAVANSGSGNVSILIGNGDGAFQPAVNFDAGMANPQSVAMGDFNHDGKLDLAVLDISLSALSVLLGNGNGSFQAAKTLALTSGPITMAVADFNLDGKSDIAISGSVVNIFLGTGDGTFQSPTQTSVPGNRSLAAADFNRDGKPDLAVSAANGVNTFLGNGDGTFQPGTIVAVKDIGSSKPAVFDFQIADVDNDDEVDLVVGATVACRQNCLGGTKVSLFLGGGSGSFGEESIIASTTLRVGNQLDISGSQIIGFVLGDFNGDEKLDVGYRRQQFSSGTFFQGQLGKGDGSFSPVLGFGPDLRVAAVADLNSDKNGDLVVFEGEDSIGVALNTSPTAGADLGIISARATPDPAGVGTNLTYTANVLNEGPKDSTGVTFTDTLPNGVSFVSGTATQGSCIRSHLEVTCDLGSLASAFGATVTILATPTATGTITNAMSVSATEDDLVLANNSATQSTTVSFTLTVAKSGAGSGTVGSSPSGIDCGGVCSQVYASGTSISLVATASENSTFGGWSGACTGTDPNSCTVTLNSDLSVTATFDITPDFSLSAEATSLTLKRGAQVSAALTIGAQGNFSGTIALACSVSGPAPMPTCGISPNLVTPGSSATLTVDAAALAALTPTQFEGTGKLYAALLPLGMLGCVLAIGFDRKRRRLWALCLLVLAAMILPAACGGSSASPAPAPTPQSYTVTVTATSGTLQHSTAISVTVQ